MQFRRLHPDLGAEVIGFDVMRSSAPADIEALRAALAEHELLLFRGDRAIPGPRQAEICSWFGACQTNANGEQHTFMDNAEAFGRDKLLFHSDNSYSEGPIEGLSLHALELPKHGAATCFVSGVAAWARLSPERQKQLAPMTARHHLVSLFYADWPDLIADQNVRRINPRSGRPILYVTEHHATRIHELPKAESDAALAELFATLYAPAHVYTHDWRMFDLLVWDNLALQHARPQAADRADGARVLQRVSIGGMSFEDILTAARARDAREKALAG
jgi:taurine dioxygenase